MRSSIGQPAGRHYANPVVLALVILIAGCTAAQPDIEGNVRAELERRSWPATSVLVVERGTVRLNLGHRTRPAQDPQDLEYPLGSIAEMFTAAAVHHLAERGEIDLVIVVLASVGAVSADTIEQSIGLRGQWMCGDSLHMAGMEWPGRRVVP
jgi:hypothetical protein